MSQPDTDNKEPYLGLIILLIIVAAIWAISGFILYPHSGRGTFGDMFGAANALFSGLAFASLIYTIFLQRRELSLQRTELSLTRAELEGQKLQLSAQNDVLRIQNFENTFFQLLKLHNDIINSIDLAGSNGVTTRGRDCFNSFFRRLKNKYIAHARENQNIDLRETALAAYSKFYNELQSEIGHYFITLYNIIKFVHDSDIPNKKFYTNLVRAQLSTQELLLLFYNCASINGSEKFKPLIEEYALLKMLPPSHLLSPDEHISMYSKNAFGYK